MRAVAADKFDQIAVLMLRPGAATVGDHFDTGRVSFKSYFRVPSSQCSRRMRSAGNIMLCMENI